MNNFRNSDGCSVSDDDESNDLNNEGCDEALDECSSGEEHHESVCMDSTDESDNGDEDINTTDWDYDSECSDIDGRVETRETGKDGTKWSKVPYLLQSTTYKDPASDHFGHKINLPAGVTIDNPEDAFFLFFSDFVLSEIVKYTNIEAENNTEMWQASWKLVDTTEMRAFFGLLLTAGHLKQNNASYITLWSIKYGSPIFRATMSLGRFKSLLRFIRFDDKTTRSTRRATDKFTPIRDIFEEINKKFSQFYIPGDFLTVDEQMIGWRGRCPFLQFMPKKPDKYGMKMWWICDARTGYPLCGIPYHGKEGNVRAAAGLGKQIVLKLWGTYFGTNRLVTFDNYFGSLDLAKSLLKVKLFSLATIKKNKPFIPASFLPNKMRKIRSSVFGFKRKATLVSYVPRQSKSVILSSTIHNTAEVDDGEQQKPKIILDYNRTKGGVDVFDQIIHEYSSKRKTNRWPLAHFFNLMDASALAAYIVWTSTHLQWKTQVADRRCTFLKELCENLVRPLIARRMQNLVGVSLETRSAMEIFLPHTVAPDTDKSEDKSLEPNKNEKRKSVMIGQKRRCRLCPYTIGRQQRQQCERCFVNVCNEHCSKSILCDTCCGKLKRQK